MSERRARMGRYALWQLRDYLTNQGPSTAVVMLLFGFLSLAPFRALANAPGVRPSPERLEQMLTYMTAEMLGALVFLGTLFATSGIVANDRKFGFYRFYFAKPVGPPRFYVLLYLVYGTGLLVVSHLLFALYASLSGATYSWRITFVIAALYLSYGGVGLLLSALTRWDWLSLVTVALVSNIAWDRWGESAHPLARLVFLLPPLHRAGEINRWAVSGDGAFPGTIFWWLFCYGLACLGLAILALRHRQLATT